MNRSPSERNRSPYPALGVAALMAFAVALTAAFLAAPVHGAPASAGVHAASGSSQQWAFGGTASSSYSCSQASCFGGDTNLTANVTISLSYRYYIAWAVIYTETNVSSTQTMVEGQAALNATVSASLSDCVTTGQGVPCAATSISVNLAGKESSTGFSNITAGSVDLTYPSNGTTASAAALAVANAQSNEAFNFSGSYGVSTSGGGSPGSSGSIGFDIGGSEASTISFSTPLGLVPVNPQPGEYWTSSAPFSATGSYSGGYSFTYSYAGSSYSDNNWTTLNVAPSGSLSENGTDLGVYTLYDNYTNPPTSVSAQLIAIDFGDGAFTASDGWLLAPSGVYAGVGGALNGLGSSGPPLLSPSASTSVGIATGESAYYQSGTGFIGAQIAANTSALSGTTGGASTPSVSVQAGPEPVSVAQSQYQAILSGGSGSGSGLGSWLILAVVVVVVVLALAAVLMIRRSRRRPPAAATTAAPADAPATGGPSGPAMGTAGPQMAPPTAAAPVGASAMAPTCPTCGQPATYVAQYQRYYCYHDQRYL